MSFSPVVAVDVNHLAIHVWPTFPWEPDSGSLPRHLVWIVRLVAEENVASIQFEVREEVIFGPMLEIFLNKMHFCCFSWGHSITQGPSDCGIQRKRQINHKIWMLLASMEGAPLEFQKAIYIFAHYLLDCRRRGPAWMIRMRECAHTCAICRSALYTDNDVRWSSSSWREMESMQHPRAHRQQHFGK